MDANVVGENAHAPAPLESESETSEPYVTEVPPGDGVGVGVGEGDGVGDGLSSLGELGMATRTMARITMIRSDAANSQINRRRHDMRARELDAAAAAGTPLIIRDAAGGVMNALDALGLIIGAGVGASNAESLPKPSTSAAGGAEGCTSGPASAGINELIYRTMVEECRVVYCGV